MADDEYCKVYEADDLFTSFVQIILAFMALASLYLKRLHEVPRRTFQTWWLDVSKQGIGAVYAHCTNMTIAAVISNMVRGEYELKDQCAWYAINFLIDTTVGLFFSVIFLEILNDLARKRNWETLMHNGVYQGSDAMRHWWHQLLGWLGILTLVKFILIFILWACSPALAVIGDFVFKPLQNNIRFELVFVMIMFPGILNFFYFWIADQYLKAGPEHSGAHEAPDSDNVGALDAEMTHSGVNYVSMETGTNASGNGGGDAVTTTTTTTNADTDGVMNGIGGNGNRNTLTQPQQSAHVLT